MQYQSVGAQIARTTKRILRILLGVVVVLAIGFLALMYWGVYDEGVRAGRILRISKKGMIFKTYEGQLNVESFGAIRGAHPIAEVFDFSVAASDVQVIRELEQAALSGERVNLHYVARYAVFPWRGDTKYFIRKVQRVDAQP
jgi:hypothetical protein